MLIDAHHHLWHPERASYPWLTPALGPLNRPMEWDRLEPQLRAIGVTHTVLVQSGDNDEDTDYLLEQADAHPSIAAVVAWVPLAEPERAEIRLDELARHPAFRGVRCSIHFEDDVDWLLRPEVSEGLRLLSARGIPYDHVGVRRRHLALVPELADRHPELVVVLDHLSKPPIGKDDAWVAGWQANLRAAAANPNVVAKLSGLFPSRGDMSAWTAETIRPFVFFALEVFGADRLMWGSDWPISDLAGGYRKAWDELSLLLGELSPRERDSILWRTAARVYRIRAEDGA
ncbi:MAG: amidohydrolase family protein [Gaiellales bacterium]